MRQPLLLPAFLLTCAISAQNLIENGSFEDYSSCPTTDGQMAYALGWSDYLYSPDFWHVCGVPGMAGVPVNIIGYQYARTGFGYGGVHAFGGTALSAAGLREFMGVQLSNPLVPGQSYHASMWVSWTTTGPGTQGSCRYANDKLGMRFQIQPTFDLDWYPLPNAAQVFTEDIITDSTGWSLVEGDFMADSAYAYLFIGNFFGDLETDDTLINPDGQWGLSYYYIDDVCVTPLGGECLFTSVNDSRGASGISVFPNPFTDVLFVEGLDAQRVEVVLRDPAGRFIDAYVLEDALGTRAFQLPNLAPGIYTLTLTEQKKELYRALLIHQQ
jgi:hypothetical protein